MLSFALRRFASPAVWNRTFTTIYTPSHEWIRFEKPGKAIVGITDHAQKALGEVAFVDLPEVGSVLGEGDEVVAIESTKAVGDILMPVDGEIDEINRTLDSEPDLINRDPEGEGWIFKFNWDEDLNRQSLMERSMNKEKYSEYLKSLED